MSWLRDVFFTANLTPRIGIRKPIQTPREMVHMAVCEQTARCTHGGHERGGPEPPLRRIMGSDGGLGDVASAAPTLTLNRRSDAFAPSSFGVEIG